MNITFLGTIGRLRDFFLLACISLEPGCNHVGQHIVIKENFCRVLTEKPIFSVAIRGNHYARLFKSRSMVSLNGVGVLQAQG